MPILRLDSLFGLPCAALLAVAACSSDDRGDPLDIDGDAAGSFELPVGPALQPWLADRGYQDLPSESAVHESRGPHDLVRTFLSPGLAASLADGDGLHPRGVGAVKELYDGDTLRGWAVSVKIAEDSAGGDGWYWYEVFDTSADAAPATDGTGAGICTNCHGSGEDYVRVSFPLE
jgi:hypothetical protein